MLVVAYNLAVAKGDKRGPAACFWPRHGIRTVYEGQITDYVICFECLAVHVHSGGEKTFFVISEDPRSIFNEYLAEAAISVFPSRLDNRP